MVLGEVQVPSLVNNSLKFKIILSHKWSGKIVCEIKFFGPDCPSG